MALSWPGVGQGLSENALLADTPIEIYAGAPSSTTVTLMGGPGNNITAVCRQYLREFPLPALPPLPRSLAEERALCLAAYTQSTLLDNANSQALKWHPDTRTDAQTAADACLFMHWLALQQPDPAVRDAVATSVLAGLATAGNGDLVSRISDLAPPSAALDFGHLAQTWPLSGSTRWHRRAKWRQTVPWPSPAHWAGRILRNRRSA